MSLLHGIVVLNGTKIQTYILEEKEKLTVSFWINNKQVADLLGVTYEGMSTKRMFVITEKQSRVEKFDLDYISMPIVRLVEAIFREIKDKTKDNTYYKPIGQEGIEVFAIPLLWENTTNKTIQAYIQTHKENTKGRSKPKTYLRGGIDKIVVKTPVEIVMKTGLDFQMILQTWNLDMSIGANEQKVNFLFDIGIGLKLSRFYNSRTSLGYLKKEIPPIFNEDIAIVYREELDRVYNELLREMELEKSKEEQLTLEEESDMNDVDLSQFYHTLEQVINSVKKQEYIASKTNKTMHVRNFVTLFSKSSTYEIVYQENLQQVLNTIREHKGYVAVDTETTGLKIYHEGSSKKVDELVGIVISIMEGQAWYFPVKHNQHWKLLGYDEYKEITSSSNSFSIEYTLEPRSIPNLYNGDVKKLLLEMKDIFEEKKIVTFNNSFDFRVFYKYGIHLNNVFDAYVALSTTLGAVSGLYGKGSLKSWTSSLLHRDSLELDDMSITGKWVGKDDDDLKDKKTVQRSKFNFADLPYTLVKYYACADTDNTLSLVHYIERENLINKYSSQEVFNIENNFSTVIAYSEFYGGRKDIKNMETLYDELLETKKDLLIKMQTRLAELLGGNIEVEQEIIKVTKGIESKKVVKFLPTTFRPSSTEELSVALYYILGYAPQYTDSGSLSTASEKLEYLTKYAQSEQDPDGEFLIWLNGYRDNNKLESDFFKNWGTENFDTYFHSRVNQFLETGRLSVNKPNYQSFNNSIKKYIIPRENYYMMDCDYSAIELRAIAMLSQEKYMLDAFENTDLDIHKALASKMYKKHYLNISKEERQKSKAANFGIPYSLSAMNLGYNITNKKDEESTRMAEQLIEDYFKNLPTVKVYFDINKAMAVPKEMYGADRRYARGYSETYFGRKRYFDYLMDIQEKKGKKVTKDSIARQGGNAPVQGSAADIFKGRAVRLYKYLKENNLLGKILIVAFVHDEMLFEISEDIHPIDALKIMRKCLIPTREDFIRNKDIAKNVGKPLNEIVLEDRIPPYLIGAGFGHNWYTAKKVEIPERLQQALTNNDEVAFERYFKDFRNIPKGDRAKYIADEANYYIKEFSVEMVLNYITNPENANKEVELIIYEYLLDIVKGYKEKKYGKGSKEANSVDFEFNFNEFLEVCNSDDELREVLNRYDLSKKVKTLPLNEDRDFISGKLYSELEGQDNSNVIKKPLERLQPKNEFLETKELTYAEKYIHGVELFGGNFVTGLKDGAETKYLVNINFDLKDKQDLHKFKELFLPYLLPEDKQAMSSLYYKVCIIWRDKITREPKANTLKYTVDYMKLSKEHISIFKQIVDYHKNKSKK